jgi:hypothetical protein
MNSRGDAAQALDATVASATSRTMAYSTIRDTGKKYADNPKRFRPQNTSQT